MNIAEYILTPVKTDDDVEYLRCIRNECAEFMTRNKNQITKEQQAEWFKNVDNEYTQLYLVRQHWHGSIIDPVPIGYGILRMECGSILLTGGLVKAYRGMGIGYRLFSMLLEKAKKIGLPIELQVLDTNESAKNLYSKLGFRIIHECDGIIDMEYINE